MKVTRTRRGAKRPRRKLEPRCGSGTASVATSARYRDPPPRRRDQRAGLLVERELASAQRGEHRLPSLEAAGPAAALAGRDTAVHARLTDGHDDVEVTAAELRVDDGCGDGDRLRPA